MPKYFKKQGKILKGTREITIRRHETLTSLVETTPNQTLNIRLPFLFNNLNLIKKASYVFAAFILSFFTVFAFNNTKISQFPISEKYNVFTSEPLVIESTSSSVIGKDARANRINAIFDAYKCPLYGYGDSFVAEADKNNIPWWLVASVSFQESGCGKKTPTNDGNATYNAYGWGVWGGKAYQFNDWDHGISVVSKYMNDKFYSKGISDTCDIMKVYTPPSNGSWCQGVNYFGELIQSYETP